MNKIKIKILLTSTKKDSNPYFPSFLNESILFVSIKRTRFITRKIFVLPDTVIIQTTKPCLLQLPIRPFKETFKSLIPTSPRDITFLTKLVYLSRMPHCTKTVLYTTEISKPDPTYP